MSFQLIPITGKNVIEKWGHFIEGVKKVEKFSTGQETLAMIYNDVLEGKTIMWAGFLENKYVGFVVTQIISNIFGEKSMLIRAIYSKEKLDSEVYLEGLQILDNYTRSWGVKKMEFITKRDKGFEKLLSGKDWKQKYVMFEREVI